MDTVLEYIANLYLSGYYPDIEKILAHDFVAHVTYNNEEIGHSELFDTEADRCSLNDISISKDGNNYSVNISCMRFYKIGSLFDNQFNKSIVSDNITILTNDSGEFSDITHYCTEKITEKNINKAVIDDYDNFKLVLTLIIYMYSYNNNFTKLYDSNILDMIIKNNLVSVINDNYENINIFGKNDFIKYIGETYHNNIFEIDNIKIICNENYWNIDIIDNKSSVNHNLSICIKGGLIDDINITNKNNIIVKELVSSTSEVSCDESDSNGINVPEGGENGYVSNTTNLRDPLCWDD